MIVVLFLWFQAAATVAVVAVGLPSEFSVTWPLLVAGAALALAGVILASWVFVYRHPVLMIQSTGATFSRLLGESTPSGRAAPVEPLALLGPHRWVRHPLYLSLILSLVGWAVFTQSSITLLEAGLFVMWFVLVEIPFEEAELRALYGAPYERYSQRTPQLIPFMPSRWPPTGSGR